MALCIIGLPYDIEKWRKHIVQIAKSGYERRDCSAEVAAAGYSLKATVKKLEKIYAGEQ
jgi:hypothetical protein